MSQELKEKVNTQIALAKAELKQWKDYDKNMADKFAKTYYGEDFQIQRIDWEDDCLHYNLQINDEYRNIDEIYTALWYDIPKKILFEYKDESVESALKKETFMNLKNFYLMKIGECQKSEQLKIEKKSI